MASNVHIAVSLSSCAASLACSVARPFRVASTCFFSFRFACDFNILRDVNTSPSYSRHPLQIWHILATRVCSIYVRKWQPLRPSFLSIPFRRPRSNLVVASSAMTLSSTLTASRPTASVSVACYCRRVAARRPIRFVRLTGTRFDGSSATGRAACATAALAGCTVCPVSRT
jgi:hypothetical protein